MDPIHAAPAPRRLRKQLLAQWALLPVAAALVGLPLNAHAAANMPAPKGSSPPKSSPAPSSSPPAQSVSPPKSSPPAQTVSPPKSSAPAQSVSPPKSGPAAQSNTAPKNSPPSPSSAPSQSSSPSKNSPPAPSGSPPKGNPSSQGGSPPKNSPSSNAGPAPRDSDGGSNSVVMGVARNRVAPPNNPRIEQEPLRPRDIPSDSPIGGVTQGAGGAPRTAMGPSSISPSPAPSAGNTPAPASPLSQSLPPGSGSPVAAAPAPSSAGPNPVGGLPMDPLPASPRNTSKLPPSSPPMAAARPPHTKPPPQGAGQRTPESSAFNPAAAPISTATADPANAQTNPASASGTRGRSAEEANNAADASAIPTLLQPDAQPTIAGGACSDIQTQAHSSRPGTTLVDLTGDGLITAALPTNHVRNVLQRAGYSDVRLDAPANFCLPQAQVASLMRPSSVTTTAANNAPGRSMQVLRTRGGVVQLVEAPPAPLQGARGTGRVQASAKGSAAERPKSKTASSKALTVGKTGGNKLLSRAKTQTQVG